MKTLMRRAGAVAVGMLLTARAGAMASHSHESASPRMESMLSAAMDTFPYRAAGVSFVVPAGWTSQVIAGRVVVSSADSAIKVYIYGFADTQGRSGDKIVSTAVGEGLSTQQTTSSSHSQVDGMDVLSSSGTGAANGLTLKWTVRVVSAKATVVMVSMAAPDVFDRNLTALEAFLKTIHRLPDEALTTISDARLKSLLEELGIRSSVVRENLLRFTSDGHAVGLYNKGSFIQLFAAFSKKPVTLRQVNEWNQTKRYSRASRDSDGDPVLQAELDFTAGVSSGEILEFISTFNLSVGVFFKSLPETAASQSVLSQIESFKAPAYPVSQYLDREGYDYRIQAGTPVSSKTMTLVHDVCLIRNYADSTFKPVAATPDTISAALKQYETRPYGQLSGLRPWTHTFFVRSLSTTERSQLVGEVTDILRSGRVKNEDCRASR